MVARIDIPLRTNAARNVRIQNVDENDTPIDRTGQTFQLDIKPAAGGALVVSLTDGDGITINELDEGDITLEFPAGLTAGDYVYDLLALTSGFDPETVCYGTITVTQGVTAP